ncbi:hypothetical protein DFH27DRAFT_577606 [Peziza echinospora]|nr:hypothetical protein DFH27DRAFT_577606 [Peziza echinospora]
MFPYGQPYRPPMPPGMPGAFGFPPGMAGMGLPPGAPGMPPPPGMPPGAPGVMHPPGVPLSQANMPTRPGMAGFVPPANLPNINFNAPIIRLGTSNSRTASISMDGRGGSGSGGKSGGDGGKGSGGGISFVRGGMDSIMESLAPPTQEEGLKTIFVGGIPKDLTDEWVERILKAVARLRRWVRATDEDGRPCKFGFAEYEDIAGLECAIEVLKDLEIPPVDDRKEAVKLMMIHDENAPAYIQKYNESMDTDQESRTQFVERARADLKAAITEYGDPTKRAARSAEPTASTETDTDGAKKEEGGVQPEIVTIPLSADDELSDIPADMREMVAKEIAAFRERSTRRDMERLKREEEVERMERERNSGQRVSRLASPPISAPTGPSGGSNSIPIGPSRLREPPSSAPTAPSRMSQQSGSQIPRDYQKGVAFVNGGGLGGNNTNTYWSKEEEESTLSDDALEQRRKEKKAREQESTFLDHERRWLNRERSRTSALERETARDKEDEARALLEKEAMAKRLAEWDDDVEASKKLEDYYVDRSLWIRNRTAFRAKEIELDERDKSAELRQLEQEKRHAAESMADSFLARQAEEMENSKSLASPSATTFTTGFGPRDRHLPTQTAQPQKFKLSLGAAAAAAKKASDTNHPQRTRKTAAEVEGLLEDEEEDASKTKRVLIPITYDTSTAGVVEWKVQWDHVDDQIVREKLKPFVEKKIVEYLGVQEQDLISFVLDHIRKRGSAEELVKELEVALDEDAAEVMVKKVWRMVIFYSESEKRGLS